jgi:RNA-directed DNA polymerase
MIDGIKTPSEEGTVQGSPLSPLLSNVVLDELDKELEKRDLEFCRFADDCNIYPFHLKDPKANRFKSSQIEEKNEVNIKLILTSFFYSILERFQFDFLGWL